MRKPLFAEELAASTPPRYLPGDPVPDSRRVVAPVSAAVVKAYLSKVMGGQAYRDLEQCHPGGGRTDTGQRLHARTYELGHGRHCLVYWKVWRG